MNLFLFCFLVLLRLLDSSLENFSCVLILLEKVGWFCFYGFRAVFTVFDAHTPILE